MADQVVSFNTFSSDTKIYTFKEPLTVVIKNIAPEEYICDYPDLGVYVFATTATDCVKELSSYLEFLYREYAFEDDTKLDSKAQELKTKLLNMLASVKDLPSDASQ
jgi:hypothetical protein